jgi:hypothetical protein
MSSKKGISKKGISEKCNEFAWVDEYAKNFFKNNPRLSTEDILYYHDHAMCYAKIHYPELFAYKHKKLTKEKKTINELDNNSDYLVVHG